MNHMFPDNAGFNKKYESAREGNWINIQTCHLLQNQVLSIWSSVLCLSVSSNSDLCMYLGKLINIDFSYYLVFLSFCMPCPWFVHYCFEVCERRKGNGERNSVDFIYSFTLALLKELISNLTKASLVKLWN